MPLFPSSASGGILFKLQTFLVASLASELIHIDWHQLAFSSPFTREDQDSGWVLRVKGSGKTEGKRGLKVTFQGDMD